MTICVMCARLRDAIASRRKVSGGTHGATEPRAQVARRSGEGCTVGVLHGTKAPAAALRQRPLSWQLNEQRSCPSASSTFAR